MTSLASQPPGCLVAAQTLESQRPEFLSLGQTVDYVVDKTSKIKSALMASKSKIVELDPPQRRKWIKFGDLDEEALEFRQSHEKGIAMSVSNPSISSSISSMTFSSNSDINSSVSSDSLDYSGKLRRKSAIEQEPYKPPIEFNASFGGTNLNGEAAGLQASWLNPNQAAFSSFSSSVDENILRYSAFAELEENKDFSLGWSKGLRGEGNLTDTEGNIRSRPDSLRIPAETDVTVETLSTPEISGIRSSTWSGSPNRTFVRNFP